MPLPSQCHIWPLLLAGAALVAHAGCQRESRPAEPKQGPAVGALLAAPKAASTANAAPGASACNEICLKTHECCLAIAGISAGTSCDPYKPDVACTNATAASSTQLCKFTLASYRAFSGLPAACN